MQADELIKSINEAKTAKLGAKLAWGGISVFGKLATSKKNLLTPTILVSQSSMVSVNLSSV